MTTDIFIVTYLKDAHWLHWSLKTVLKHLSGYRDIHIVVQDSRVAEVQDIVKAPQDANIKWHYGQPWPGQGYYAQQYLKMTADNFSDAEYLFMMDSDLFVPNPCNVMDFFEGGKPAWLWAYYTDFTQDVPWQQPTEKATGLPCPMEYMQALPMAIHRSTLQRTREALEFIHGVELAAYIIGEANAGRKFSEYNVLGRMAWEHQRDLYSFIDRNRNTAGEPSQSHWPKGYYGGSRQYWSRAPIKDHMPEIMTMLGEETTGLRIEANKYGHWAPSNDTHFKKWILQAGRLDHDKAFLSRILPYIKPGDTVVDVGANIGTHSEAYAKATAGVDGGRVLCFEPNPLPFECLRRNMMGHGHVEVFNYGLGAHAGHAGMQMSDNVGASYMVPGEGFKIVPLDDLALTRLDFCKVDVEGFELAFLIGAAKTIAQFRPVMVIEMNPGALARNGVLPEDIYGWLRLRGYDILGHEDNSLQWDIIAVPNPIQA